MSDRVLKDDSSVRDAGCRRGSPSGFLDVPAAGGFFAWQRFAPVAKPDGWNCRFHDEGVTRVNGLARFRR